MKPTAPILVTGVNWESMKSPLHYIVIIYAADICACIENASKPFITLTAALPKAIVTCMN